jgi:hypothetical protein
MRLTKITLYDTGYEGFPVKKQRLKVATEVLLKKTISENMK